MKIFLTGGTGFIGRAVVPKLRERGHEVTGLARDDAGAHALEDAGVHALVADLADGDVLARAAEDADATVHLALALGPTAGESDAAAIESLLGALRGSAKVFVGASAAALVGDTRGRVVDETEPLLEGGPNQWRVTNERRVIRAKDEGVRAVVVRPPPMVFGRGGGRLVTTLVRDARTTGIGHYLGTGEQAWSTAHVDDVAALFVLACERAPSGEVYIAAAGEPTRWHEIAAAISAAAGGDGHVAAWTPEQARSVVGFFAGLMPLDVRVSGAKARALGWSPRGESLLEGIKAYREDNRS